MVGAGGDFVGLGLPAMVARSVFDVMEWCLDTVQRRRMAREKPDGVGLNAGSDLGTLRDVLTDRGYAASTAAKYVSCVARFLRSVGCPKPGELTADDVVEYLAELRRAGLGYGTQRLHLCALRAVFDRLLRLGITVGIQHAPRPAPRAPATEEEVRLLRGACRGERDRLVIDMLNQTKLRPGQLRMVAAPKGALHAGRNGHRARPDDKQSSEPIPLGIAADERAEVAWLLPSPRRACPVSTRTIRRVVERASRLCGIRTTCTALRKAAAVPWRAAA